jgi:hypothetical protein
MADTVNTWLTSANKLLLKKMAVTGLIGFLSVFLPAVLKGLDEIEGGAAHHFSTEFWFSLLAGAVAAGLRAVLALSPWNLLPTDVLHGFRKDKPTEILVEASEGQVPAPPPPPVPPKAASG